MSRRNWLISAVLVLLCGGVMALFTDVEIPALRWLRCNFSGGLQHGSPASSPAHSPSSSSSLSSSPSPYPPPSSQPSPLSPILYLSPLPPPIHQMHALDRASTGIAPT
ncbi:MAG TPA: hypothetical protein DDY43_02480 [Synechococcales bacterium UBA10510]|nr:hypothetical protein [Synechococcales bacterium UBA10510]